MPNKVTPSKIETDPVVVMIFVLTLAYSHIQTFVNNTIVIVGPCTNMVIYVYVYENTVES